MLQRQVPHGERLELGIAGADAALVLIIELREADGHLARAGAGGCHDDEFTGGLHVVVLAKTFVGGYQVYIVWIAVYQVMNIGANAQPLQAMAELVGSVLSVVVGDDDRAHHEVAALELVAQSQHVLVVGDAQVSAYLVLLNVLCRYNDDNLQLVAQLGKHTQFRVGLEAWQHA